jgi:O-antigen/teichoic acid export membrane protein
MYSIPRSASVSGSTEPVDETSAAHPLLAGTDVLDTPAAGGAAIRGGVLRLGGYCASVLLGLAAVPLLLRHLGVVDFGRYTLVLSLIAIIQGTTEGGLGAVGLREYSVLDERAREAMMRQLLGLRIVLTMSGVAAAVAFTVLAGYDSTIVSGTAIAGLGLLELVLFNLVSIPLAAGLRFGWVTIAEVSRQAVITLLIVALVLGGAGLLPLLAVQIPAGAAALVIAVPLVRRLIPLAPSFDRRHWWALVRDTLPYAAAIAVSAIYFRVTIVIMSLVSSDDQTGYFAASFRVIEVLVGVPLLIASAAFPIISRAKRDDDVRLRYASQRTFDAMIVVGVWVALFVALSAPFIIGVLAGAKFGPSVGTLRIQALALACTFASVTCGFLLLAMRRHRAILVGNLVPLALGVALTFALAPAHGARGAATAAVAAELGLAVAMLSLVRGDGPDRIPLSLRGLATTCLAGALAATTGVALLAWTHPIAAAVGASVVYGGVLLASGQIPPELVHALRARMADRT